MPELRRPSPDPRLRLAAGGIDVWRLQLDQPWNITDVVRGTLSPEERSRASRLRSPQDGHRYEVARGCLRAILGAYLGRAAQELTFRREPLGRLALDSSEGLTFSVAHADGRGVVAVAIDRSIGADLEASSSASQIEEIADRFLPPRHVAGVRGAPPFERPERWLELWTELEARAKLDGRGLSDLSPDTAARLMNLQAHVVRLHVGEGFVGTLVYQGGSARLRTLDFDFKRLLEDGVVTG